MFTKTCPMCAGLSPEYVAEYDGDMCDFCHDSGQVSVWKLLLHRARQYASRRTWQIGRLLHGKPPWLTDDDELPF